MAGNVSQKVAVKKLNGSPGGSVDTEHDGQQGNLTIWCLQLSGCDFGVVHRASTKHQSAYTLSLLPIAGMDEFPMVGDVLLLMGAKVRQKG